MTLTAIIRELNAGIGDCELTYAPRTTIDVELASRQHRQYESVLSSLGCNIIGVPTEPGLVDSVFIEDTAIVLDEMAVLCRPGAESRRPEVQGVAEILKKYRTLASIEPPGTLDGGDVLCVGKTIFAGLSTRTNQSGIDQLRGIVAEHGYSVTPVETTRCLHLKSAVSEVATGTLLINPDWVSSAPFGDYELIPINKSEAHAANALLVDDTVIYPDSFPRTMDVLVARDINVTPIDLSELQKAEGGVTCCSLLFNTS